MTWALAKCCKGCATSTWVPLGAHNEVTHERVTHKGHTRGSHTRESHTRVTHEGHNHRTSLLLILPQSVDEREASMFVQVDTSIHIRLSAYHLHYPITGLSSMTLAHLHTWPATLGTSALWGKFINFCWLCKNIVIQLGQNWTRDLVCATCQHHQ